jgi:hypothetical protein
MMPAGPTIIGNSTCQDNQEYMIPPHVRGIRNDTVEAMKKIEPSQSKRLILERRAPCVGAS